MKHLQFYQHQSLITDPRDYRAFFDDLPRDVAAIKALIQGLILHFWDGPMLQYQIPISRLYDLETRYVAKMLKKLLQLNAKSLMHARPLAQRIVGSCRDYATLFCAMLRHQQIPARTRVAFSAFYFKEYKHDEIILEYYNDKIQKWCLVDPRVTQSHIDRQQLNIDFDLLDCPREQLIVPGLAWQMARQSPKIAEQFCGGDRKKNKGLWYIRDRLIQDIAALNSFEMQLWDVWGMMLQSHEIDNDEQQLAFLDQLALWSCNPDQYFPEMTLAFRQDPRLKVPQSVTTFSPIQKKYQVTLWT